MPPDGAYPIGTAIRHRPALTYCRFGCADCDPARLSRCWLRRAQVRSVLEVIGYLAAPDPCFGVGYLVKLVGGGPWERRAFGSGSGGLVWADSVEPVETP